MFITDILIALWAVSLLTAIPLAYFKGAKRQREAFAEYCNELGVYLSDRQWKEVDISRKKGMPK